MRVLIALNKHYVYLSTELYEAPWYHGFWISTRSLRKQVILKLLTEKSTIKDFGGGGIVFDIPKEAYEFFKILSKVDLRNRSSRRALKDYLEGYRAEKKTIELLLPSFIAKELGQ